MITTEIELRPGDTITIDGVTIGIRRPRAIKGRVDVVCDGPPSVPVYRAEFRSAARTRHEGKRAAEAAAVMRRVWRYQPGLPAEGG